MKLFNGKSRSSSSLIILLLAAFVTAICNIIPPGKVAEAAPYTCDIIQNSDDGTEMS